MILDLISHPIHKFFPRTIYRAQKIINASSNIVSKKMYAVCPNEDCNAIYALESGTCMSILRGERERINECGIIGIIDMVPQLKIGIVQWLI